jgi:hypothetical protein
LIGKHQIYKNHGAQISINQASKDKIEKKSQKKFKKKLTIKRIRIKFFFLNRGWMILD